MRPINKEERHSCVAKRAGKLAVALVLLSPAYQSKLRARKALAAIPDEMTH
jgi:hypothetical protein